LNYSPRTYKTLSFHDARASFLEGSDTPRAYLERCLETIAARDGVVQAWVVRNEEGARAAADAATERYRRGQPLSPLDGMPIGIKDLFETRDMPTQMGSPLYLGNHPKRDTAFVQALRHAGAVVLGKLVTTELGMSTAGATTNPFDPERTPGGSSSGTGAAVGARMVPAAIGSHAWGSGLRPASFCANYTIKPTFGAINRGERQGSSLSHISVHAGSLEDMWRVAIEIANRAGGDAGYPGLYGPVEPPAAVRPSRLILMQTSGWSDVDTGTRAALDKMLVQLRSQGVKIVDRPDDPLIEAFEEAIANSSSIVRDLLSYESRMSWENLYAQNPDKMSASLIGRLEVGRQLTPLDYRNVLAQRDNARRLHAALAPLADAIITLSSVGPAPLMGTTGGTDGKITHTTGDPVFNAPSSILGAPAISIPVMAVSGMPVGIQLMGQQHADARLTGVARWICENMQPVEQD